MSIGLPSGAFERLRVTLGVATGGAATAFRRHAGSMTRATTPKHTARRNLELGIWNLECIRPLGPLAAASVHHSRVRIPNSQFQIPNSNGRSVLSRPHRCTTLVYAFQ